MNNIKFELPVSIEETLRSLGFYVIIRTRPAGLKEFDGMMILRKNQKGIRFYFLYLANVLPHHLLGLEKFWGTEKHILIIARSISQAMKEELQKLKISFIEIDGSVYVDAGDFYVLVDKSKSTNGQRDLRGSALTPAGVQLVFHYLMDESILNRTIRHSAEIAGTTPSNIHYINNGLLERGLLRIKANGLFEFADKSKFIDEWVQAYGQKLKPKMLKGTFRFADAEKFRHWYDIKLGGESLWGGEPAANLLTRYLKPSELTIYTSDSAVNLMKRLKLLPDRDGNVRLYRKFWHESIDNGSATVPPLLVYADLISTNDSRCIETAKIIYERFLP